MDRGRDGRRQCRPRVHGVRADLESDSHRRRRGAGRRARRPDPARHRDTRPGRLSPDRARPRRRPPSASREIRARFTGMVAMPSLTVHRARTARRDGAPVAFDAVARRMAPPSAQREGVRLRRYETDEPSRAPRGRDQPPARRPGPLRRVASLPERGSLAGRASPRPRCASTSTTARTSSRSRRTAATPSRRGAAWKPRRSCPTAIAPAPRAR